MGLVGRGSGQTIAGPVPLPFFLEGGPEASGWPVRPCNRFSWGAIGVWLCNRFSYDGRQQTSPYIVASNAAAPCASD